MAVLDTLAQFYVWSWIATIGVLLLALVILFARDSVKRPANSQESRLGQSLFDRLLLCVGIDPENYARIIVQPTRSQQLRACSCCDRRTQCAQELAQGRASLMACPNAEPVTRYLASRGMPA